MNDAAHLLAEVETARRRLEAASADDAAPESDTTAALMRYYRAHGSPFGDDVCMAAGWLTFATSTTCN